MRALWLFAICICSLYAQNANNPPTVQANSLQELVNMLNNVDNDLMSSVKDDYAEAQKKRDALRANIGQEVKEELTNTISQYQKKIEEINQLKIDIQNRWESEKQTKLQEFERRLADAEKAFNDERKAEREQMKQEIEVEKQAFLNAINSKKNQKKQQIEEIQKYLDEVNALYQQHLKEQDAEKQRRMDALKEKGSNFLKELQAKKTELDEQGQKLKQDIADYSAKKSELKDMASEGLKQGVQAVLAEGVEKKLQDRLNEEMKEVVKEEVMNRLHPKDVQFEAPAAWAVSSAPKASTLLDTLTGASAWETIAWVLLGLCILLSIALIAMIVYQVSQRGKYNKIDGSNQAQRFSERSPIYPGNTAPPLPYTEEKAIIPAPGSSAVAIPSTDQAQQF